MKTETLDLATLEHIKGFFDICSDTSTRCIGYNHLIKIIESKKAELTMYELLDALTDVSQLINGWNATEKEWTEWDKSVLQKVHALQNKINGKKIVIFK